MEEDKEGTYPVTDRTTSIKFGEVVMIRCNVCGAEGDKNIFNYEG
jgi:hypothetical protein